MEPGALVTVDVPTEFPLVLFKEPYIGVIPGMRVGTVTTDDVGIIITELMTTNRVGREELFVLVLFGTLLGWQQASSFHVLSP